MVKVRPISNPLELHENNFLSARKHSFKWLGWERITRIPPSPDPSLPAGRWDPFVTYVKAQKQVNLSRFDNIIELSVLSQS